MKFLHILDDIARFDVGKDTSFVFLLEAQARGHENYFCSMQRLSAGLDGVTAWAAPLHVKPVQGEHFEAGRFTRTSAEDFDAVFMRKDPPFDSDFFFATHLLSLIDESRTLVFNRASGLREATEKLFILRYPDLIPETLVSADSAEVFAFRDDVGGDIVVKPLDGCGGAGIFRIISGDLNANSIVETLTHEGHRPLMAQRFLPESRAGDMRLIYLDGRALGGVLRVPRSDDLRGNIHVGGRCEKAVVGDREREICERLAPDLEKLGVWFVGLDIIGGLLTEVNVTSPTGIQEVNTLDGVKLEADVIDFVEAKCKALVR